MYEVIVKEAICYLVHPDVRGVGQGWIEHVRQQSVHSEADTAVTAGRASLDLLKSHIEARVRVHALRKVKGFEQDP